MTSPGSYRDRGSAGGRAVRSEIVVPPSRCVDPLPRWLRFPVEPLSFGMETEAEGGLSAGNAADQDMVVGGSDRWRPGELMTMMHGGLTGGTAIAPIESVGE